MANTKLTILISTLLLLPLALAHTSPEVVVEGMVYCQNCKNAGTWSLSDAKLIPSAKISVYCKDYKGRGDFYNVYETDHKGHFFAELKGFKMEHALLEHPLQACKVKLVSSSQENCNIPTNVNYGLSGAPLRFDNVVISKSNYEAVVYETGPLAYRPYNCPSN